MSTLLIQHIQSFMPRLTVTTTPRAWLSVGQPEHVRHSRLGSVCPWQDPQKILSLFICYENKWEKWADAPPEIWERNVP